MLCTEAGTILYYIIYIILYTIFILYSILSVITTMCMLGTEWIPLVLEFLVNSLWNYHRAFAFCHSWSEGQHHGAIFGQVISIEMGNLPINPSISRNSFGWHEFSLAREETKEKNKTLTVKENTNIHLIYCRMRKIKGKGWKQRIPQLIWVVNNWRFSKAVV